MENFHLLLFAKESLGKFREQLVEWASMRVLVRSIPFDLGSFIDLIRRSIALYCLRDTR